MKITLPALLSLICARLTKAVARTGQQEPFTTTVVDQFVRGTRGGRLPSPFMPLSLSAQTALLLTRIDFSALHICR